MDLSSIIFILLTGLGLGLAHSIDPDNIVAVSTLLCNNKSLRKSIASATAWGVGHSAVLFIIGLLILTLSVVIPEAVVHLFDERGIALLFRPAAHHLGVGHPVAAGVGNVSVIRTVLIPLRIL